MSKRKVNQYLSMLRTLVEGIDTPAEVRNTVHYTWMVMLSNELNNKGVPEITANKAAAAMIVKLPDDFHNEYREEFLEFIQLMSKALYVLYVTISDDFHPDIADEMFISRVQAEGAIEIEL